MKILEMCEHHRGRTINTRSRGRLGKRRGVYRAEWQKKDSPEIRERKQHRERIFIIRNGDHIGERTGA